MDRGGGSRSRRRTVLKAISAGAATLYFPGLAGCRPADPPRVVGDPALDAVSPTPAPHWTFAPQVEKALAR